MSRAARDKNSKPLILWGIDRHDEDRQVPMLISLRHNKIQIESTCASMLTITKGDFELLAQKILALEEEE